MNTTTTPAPTPAKLKLTDERHSFKPFKYPWCFEMWEKSEAMHWLPKEVPMQNDVDHWNNRLSKSQKHFLLQIFRLFTQSDVSVAGAYIKNYLPTFPHPEVQMMLLSFGAREAVHIAAYAHLIETLGLPDKIFNEFLEYEAMAAKQKYFDEIEGQNKKRIIQQMTAVSAFTEGMQLFSSFAMLLNFGRQGLMPGMVKIVTWSILDEDLHVEGMTKLFRTFIKENADVWNDDLKSQLYTIAEKMVELEDKFIDLAYEQGGMDGLEKADMHQYIRYISDRRLIGLGLRGIFKAKVNPLPWVDEMTVLQSHSNFFEQTESSYAKGSLTGNWNDVWGAAQQEEHNE
jgi:ribonucleoside-diphosphate reductase beta chain